MRWYAYGLEAIEDFLEYDLEDTTSDEVKIMEQILRTAGKYLSEEELRDIKKAYIYAAEAHYGQKRLSGEDYIVHPLKATQILMTLKPDAKTIQSCILHDVIEDTEKTYQDIKQEFGQEVADLCEGLVKVSKVRYHGEDRQIETLKKTFLAMASDLRVIFIKIADRIHNIQTLHFHPKPEKRERIALETLKVYVPICKRLGLYQFQLYLENGVFKILHPQEYEEVMIFLKKKYPYADKEIIKGKNKIVQLLEDNGLQHFKVTGRIKSPYRIYEKLIKKYHSFDPSKVLDVIAFRVIVDTIPECYQVLGVIHSAYNPLIKKIKDYIAVPKFNDYQSLHTTILGLYPFPIEIQIRTQEMHMIAEFGVAAHFLYKEPNQETALTPRQSQWMKSLQESVEKYQNEEDRQNLQNKLSLEFLSQSIFVYTPKGDVIELSKGSTVLDFAFKVHTEIGLKFKNALVNNTITPINHILSSGDIVDINTHRNSYSATKHRNDYLNNPSAKAKLNRFLRQQERDSYLKRGMTILENKLQQYHLPSLGSKQDNIKKHFSKEELEHIFIQLANKSQQALVILKEVYDIQTEKPLTKKDNKKTPSPLKKHILIDDSSLFDYNLCQLCKPKPGQKIIARSGKDGIKIHTMLCQSLKTVDYGRLIKAKWFGQEDAQYLFHIELSIAYQAINLIDLLGTLQNLGIAIEDISITRSDNSFYVVTIESGYTNPGKIAYVINYLNNTYKNSLSIKKSIS